MAHPTEHGWVSESPGWGPDSLWPHAPTLVPWRWGRRTRGLSLEEQSAVLAAAEAKARVDVTREGHSIAGECQAQEAWPWKVMAVPPVGRATVRAYGGSQKGHARRGREGSPAGQWCSRALMPVVFRLLNPPCAQGLDALMQPWSLRGEELPQAAGTSVHGMSRSGGLPGPTAPPPPQASAHLAGSWLGGTPPQVVGVGQLQHILLLSPTLNTRGPSPATHQHAPVAPGTA